MSRFFALLLLTTFAAGPLVAQESVNPDDLDGTWQLHFEIDAAEGNGPFERIALKAVIGLLDEVDVRFSFQDEQRLRIMVDALGDKEEEWSEWSITEKGQLMLGDTGPVDFDSEDTFWMMDDGELWAYSVDSSGNGLERKGMYLTRMGG